uniref:Pleckstrin homology and RUN domain containing M1 n=1 Tax=Pelodiscus sinensis TaxID=13735 RepID=K7FBL9_PELSI
MLQLIKKQLVSSIKGLQKQYATSDALVTSEDDHANALCCALEAVFVHGLKAKYIKPEAGGKGKKLGGRTPLPQPVFWGLLKVITHRNIISELEHLSFISTDVGRCRAWLRLALNDGLMECYLKLLLQETSRLPEYYQTSALLLDVEECEFLLSFLQGLASLTFELSYKSAVLNEWTVTPLALSGLCPVSELLEPLTPFSSELQRKESLGSVSHSSGSDDSDVRPSVLLIGKNEDRSNLTCSTLSLNTTSCSQPSSSPGSGSLLQANCTRSPGRDEVLLSSDSDVGPAGTEEEDRSLQEVLSEFSKAQQVREPSEEELGPSLLALAPGQLASPPAVPTPTPLPLGAAAESAPCAALPPETGNPPCPWADEPATASRLPAPPSQATGIQASQPVAAHKDPSRQLYVIDPEGYDGPSQINGHKESQEDHRPVTEFLLSPAAACPKRRDWISEDDFSRPSPEGSSKGLTGSSGSSPEGVQEGRSAEPSSALRLEEASRIGRPQAAPEQEQKGFHVVHRRQIGLSNPFRGLLKLGTLERRGAMGLWKELCCELSPLELRLFLDHEERVCLENLSLLRCESLGRVCSDGRFELVFSGKRLCLRAPSRDEAEDWLDRIHEALRKCRPQQEEEWETLDCPEGALEGLAVGALPGESAALPPASSAAGSACVWTSALAPELDAVKETVLYMDVDRAWAPFIFSLSLDALKCFKVRNHEKILSNSYGIETIQDILPDTSLGPQARPERGAPERRRRRGVEGARPPGADLVSRNGRGGADARGPFGREFAGHLENHRKGKWLFAAVPGGHPRGERPGLPELHLRRLFPPDRTQFCETQTLCLLWTLLLRRLPPGRRVCDSLAPHPQLGLDKKSNLSTSVKIPESDPRSTLNQPEAGEREPVRPRGADESNPQKPRAAETAGRLPPRVSQRGPEGAQQKT